MLKRDVNVLKCFIVCLWKNLSFVDSLLVSKPFFYNLFVVMNLGVKLEYYSLLKFCQNKNGCQVLCFVVKIFFLDENRQEFLYFLGNN